MLFRSNAPVGSWVMGSEDSACAGGCECINCGMICDSMTDNNDCLQASALALNRLERLKCMRCSKPSMATMKEADRDLGSLWQQCWADAMPTRVNTQLERLKWAQKIRVFLVFSAIPPLSSGAMKY